MLRRNDADSEMTARIAAFDWPGTPLGPMPGWPEMWHIIGEQLNSVLATGEATWSDDQLLSAMRFGYLEEAYFTYSYSAIRDESGAVAGVFTAVTETTRRVLSERRLRTLRALGEVTAAGRAAGSDAGRPGRHQEHDKTRQQHPQRYPDARTHAFQSHRTPGPLRTIAGATGDGLATVLAWCRSGIPR